MTCALSLQGEGASISDCQPGEFVVHWPKERREGNDMKRCFIFAAGTFYGLRKRPEAGDLVIAADAGYRVCQQEGLVPDVILGDFDSMEAPDAGERVCRLPVEKDDTDTLAAVKLGLERECTDFWIYGGTGGKRLDHTLANLQTLLYLRRRGARGFLCGLLWRTSLCRCAKPWNGDSFLLFAWGTGQKGWMRSVSNIPCWTRC